MAELDDFFADLDTALARDTAVMTVDADLRLEVVNAAGVSSTARVTGHGQEIRVVAQRPDLLLSVVARDDVGRMAELLAAAGVTVTVDGPRGLVATLGAEASSWIGRAVTGSSRVAPDPLGALRLAMASGPARLAAFALPAVLAALGVARLLRRRAAARSSV